MVYTMAIPSDVMSLLVVDSKPESDKPKKRYIMFLLEEWQEKIDKPLGRATTPDEAKMMICNLLEKLSTGEWQLKTE